MESQVEEFTFIILYYAFPNMQNDIISYLQFINWFGMLIVTEKIVNATFVIAKYVKWFYICKSKFVDALNYCVAKTVYLKSTGDQWYKKCLTYWMLPNLHNDYSHIYILLRLI